MKKTFKMIGMACLLGAFAFVGSSCKKNNTDTTSFKVNLPSVEETTIGEDRAYIDWADGRYMKWSREDKVMFYNLNGSDYTKSIRNVYSLYEGAGETHAHFSGGVMGDEQDPGYFAFYPAEKVENYPIGPRNSQTFDVPAVQHYNKGTMDATSLVMAAKEWAPTDDVTFKHIFGFIKVRIQADADKNWNKVEWISVTDKTFNLTGDVTIDLPGVDSEELDRLINLCYNRPDLDFYSVYMAQLNSYLSSINYHANGTGKTITLICDEPVQLGPDPNNPENPYTDFFITLRPGALATGFTVTVKFEGVAEPHVFTQFDPDATDWAYGTYMYAPNVPRYPRQFTIKPGYSMGTRVN